MESYLRRQLLERVYDSMTDEERKLFVLLSMQNRNADEIRKALEVQSAQLQDLRKHQQTFAEDFASNVAGNAAWEGISWLVRQLAGLIVKR